ncbi:MAG: hypothetical protein JO297_10305 [Nitrososphaeraceae archaeon]|nr:hypothetical protein [Nitrososphaeraceae archaeon]
MMMSFTTRWQKQQNVLELYKQGKTIKEISKMVHMSFRDMPLFINKRKTKK